jgi:integrase
MTRYDREPMTPLRRRFIDDLRLRNLSPRTIETYVLRVALFARHFGRSPELLGPEEVRAYQQHLLARQVSWSLFNQAVCALRFLYQVTLGRPDVIRHLPFAKRPRLLPVVLSPEEVVGFLEAASGGWMVGMEPRLRGLPRSGSRPGVDAGSAGADKWSAPLTGLLGVRLQPLRLGHGSSHTARSPVNGAPTNLGLCDPPSRAGLAPLRGKAP